MAKAAPNKTAKAATEALKPSRHPAAAKASKVVKAAAPVKKPAAVKAAVVSKDELRAQLEKAQNTIATLRLKSREVVRAAKTSAAQIAELEAKVAQLEKKPTTQNQPAQANTAVAQPVKRRGGRVAKKVAADVSDEADDLLPA